MKKLIRDNIVYILLVLVIWAITFPLILLWRDSIFAHLTYFWSPHGYKLQYVENLISKGDSFLAPENNSNLNKLKKAFSSDNELDLPQLDLRIMEEACDFYFSRTHKDQFLDPMTWFKKKQMLGSLIEGENRELTLSFDPQIYWKYYSTNILSALDYYKRASNFSGPEIRVPRRIEKAAIASCRLSEILIAYTNHLYSTESYIEKEYLKDELIRDDFLKKPSYIKRFWNWIRGRELKPIDLPLQSKLSPKQIQLRIWEKIRNGSVREISRSEFMESLQKIIKNKGTNIKDSAPMEALNVYERLIYFVSNQNSPIEYRRFRRERADIFLNLAKNNETYYKKAIAEYSDAKELPNPKDFPQELLPSIWIENSHLTLGIARVYFLEKKFSDTIRFLDKFEIELNNWEDSANNGKGIGIEKENLLKEFRYLKKISLMKLGRFEEADDIPGF